MVFTCWKPRNITAGTTIFQELYEVRPHRVRRDYDRVVDGPSCEHIEVYLFDEPERYITE